MIPSALERAAATAPAGSARISRGRRAHQPKKTCEEQEDVEGDDQGREDAGQAVASAGLTSSPITSRAAGDHQQRHQREGDAEGEDDLAADQGVGRVEADRQHEQRRRQRDQRGAGRAGCGGG